MCVCAAKIRTLKIKYETLILGFKTRYWTMCRSYVCAWYWTRVSECMSKMAVHSKESIKWEFTTHLWCTYTTSKKSNLSRSVSVNHHVFSDCDFHSIPLAMLPTLFFCVQLSQYLDSHCYPCTLLNSCLVVPFVLSLFIYMNICHEYLC